MTAITPTCLADPDEASMARDNMLQAENSMIQAFKETQKASIAGADVSELQENLTSVLNLVENARVAYEKGEYAVSLESSGKAINLASETASKAASLADISSFNLASYEPLAFLILTDLLLCASGLFFIDRVYKRHYKKLLEKKPKIEGCDQ